MADCYYTSNPKVYGGQYGEAAVFATKTNEINHVTRKTKLRFNYEGVQLPRAQGNRLHGSRCADSNGARVALRRRSGAWSWGRAVGRVIYRRICRGT